MPCLPALVVFGPLTFLPKSSDELRKVADAFALQPSLAAVQVAVRDLELVWNSLIAAIPGVKVAEGAAAARLLASTLEDGQIESTAADLKKNAFVMPLAIIIQAVQYLSFCQHNGFTHDSVLRQVSKAGGFQGCCAGLFTALAVASSETPEDLAESVGRAVKLAFAVGVILDADRIEQSKGGLDFQTLAVRWKADTNVAAVEQALEQYPGAYLAVVRDTRDASIVIPSGSQETVIKELLSLQATVLDTGIRGRYHGLGRCDEASTILSVLSEAGMRASPGLVRSNESTKLLTDDEATQAALQCVLQKRVEWHGTVAAALSQLSPEGNPYVLAVGNDAMPSTLSKTCTVVSQRSLVELSSSVAPSRESYQYPEHSIAIIGMGCRFPGADSIDEFWDLLTNGRSMLRQMPAQRFDPSLPYPRVGKDMKFWGNFIDDIESFDHKFFRISPREAVSMDPQQRILLQVAYEALEASGYFSVLPPAKRETSVGCYIGACSTDYDSNLQCHPPSAYSSTGTLRAFISGKISHQFGLLGPSLTFDTACSASAVAIHAACVALQTGEVEQAIAGGATIFTSPYFYENLTAAHFLSPSGATKPFDSAADGYCRGEGVGLIVLKRLSDALKDGDNVEAVIASSAVNQGRNCVPITVPQATSQKELCSKAADKAGFINSKLSFVEAHGTGTPVGDPIEMDSIRTVFGGSHREQPLYVSSVKGNIGHLEGTSGVAAVMKAVLQLQHRTVAMQASFKSLNPKIAPLEPDRICVPTKNVLLPPGRLTACVNNYGASGSNATIMLVEAGRTSIKSNPDGNKAPSVQHLTRLAAASPASLTRYCESISAWLQSHRDADIRLNDLALRLARVSNQQLATFATFSSIDLETFARQIADSSVVQAAIKSRPQPTPLVLCFGGQTSELVGLDQSLWKTSNIIRTNLDKCDQLLRLDGFPGIYPFIFQQTRIHDVVALHSALFAVQYATATAWIESGLHVDAVIGHSFGQLTALTVSGSLSLSDGLMLVAGRAKLMQKHWGPERGVMTAIEADERETMRLMDLASEGNTFSYEIACFNAARSHVVVCDTASAAALYSVLDRTATRYKKLGVPYGFHSRFTEPLLADLRCLASSLTFKVPTIYLEACSNDETWAAPTADEITNHTRRPVYFGAAVHKLQSRLGSCTWLEAGSGSGITAMARKALISSSSQEPGRDLSTDEFVAPNLSKPSSRSEVADATVKLWNIGHCVNFWYYHCSEDIGTKVPHLPSYAWEKHRHWLDLNPNMAPGLPKSDHQATSLKPELFTVRPQQPGAGTRECQLVLSTVSDEYQSLVTGFKSDLRFTAPTTLFFELVCRALAKIDVVVDGFSIQDLELMSFNFGLHGNSETTISLTPDRQGWHFRISEEASYIGAAGTFETHVLRSALRADFSRYERLTKSMANETFLSDDECECLQGQVIYNAYSKVGAYPSHYKGVRKVTASGSNLVGRICLPTGGPLSLMLIMDNVLQVAGIHANCIHLGGSENTLELRKIKQIQWAHEALATPLSRAWRVVGILTEVKDKTNIGYDLFVYNVSNQTLGLILLDVQFVRAGEEVAAFKMPTNVPVLDDSTSGKTSSERGHDANSSKAQLKDKDFEAPRTTTSVHSDLCDLIEKLAGVPKDEILPWSTLDDLGVDSLMMMELMGDVTKQFGIELSLNEQEQLTDIKSLVRLLDERIIMGSKDGIQEERCEIPSTAMLTPAASSESGDRSYAFSENITFTPSTGSSTGTKASLRGDIVESLEKSGADTFSVLRCDFDQHAVETGFKNFWTEIYPSQHRFVLAHTVDIFRELGCDLKDMHPGDTIPHLKVSTERIPLLNRLHHILVDGGLIEPRPGKDRYARSTKRTDNKVASKHSKRLRERFPRYASETLIVDAAVSRLAAYLRGREVPSPGPLDELRESHFGVDFLSIPMYSAALGLMAEYVLKILETSARNRGHRPRILEVGAGNGSVAKHMVGFLSSKGCDFEYTLADMEPGDMFQAGEQLTEPPRINYSVYNQEESPPPESRNAFDLVIAFDCMPFTSEVRPTAGNIHNLLDQNGVLCMIECTRHLFWRDLVYGQRKSWWVQEDERTHSLAGEGFWCKALRDVGFGRVSFSDGESAEAKTIRLFVAAKSNNQSMSLPSYGPEPACLLKRAGLPVQELVWLDRAGVELRADIYFPREPDRHGRKRPVALVFHGGGHLLFSRKDIPMKHVRELLKRGFLPVSVDYRLCPEVTLSELFSDCCDALRWAREDLPSLKLAEPSVTIDESRLISIGWSSGGQLAMTTGFLGPQRGIRAPDAIFALYCPSDLEHKHWSNPNYPKAAEEKPCDVADFLGGVRDYYTVTHTPLNPKRRPTLALTLADERARIVLHMNWHCQVLPVLIHGLPSRSQLNEDAEEEGWKYPPQPTLDQIQEISPLWHIRNGTYKVPTFMVHGNLDDWVPDDMSTTTLGELQKQGIPSGLIIPDQCGHAFDLFPVEDPLGLGWEAVEKGYTWICDQLGM